MNKLSHQSQLVGMSGAGLTRRQVVGGAIGLGLAGITAVSLAGCADGSAPAGAAAASGKLSGRVSFSNYQGWIGERTIPDFQSKNPGVEINQVFATGAFADLFPKLKQQPGLFDLALGSIDDIGRGIQLGVIEPIDFSAIPNMKYIDPTFVNVSVNEKGNYFVPTDYGKAGIGVRRDLVSESITSWSDLWALAPKYKDKFFAYDYINSLMGSALLLNGHKVNSTDEIEIKAAGAALEQLKSSITTLATSGIGAALANGDAAIALAYDYDVFAAQQSNPNVEWISPEEGMPGYLEGWVALAGTKSLEASQAFTDFSHQPEYYADFVLANSIAYVHSDLSALLPTELVSSPILFPPPEVLETVTFIEDVGAATEYYSKAFTKFKSA